MRKYKTFQIRYSTFQKIRRIFPAYPKETAECYFSRLIEEIINYQEKTQ